ncbi:hypothetical protein HVMH_1120 [Hydrogenovibrio marinus]|nr:hypothetical protein HVMH_1120 [Hydrogenovibrio marinus]
MPIGRHIADTVIDLPIHLPVIGKIRVMIRAITMPVLKEIFGGILNKPENPFAVRIR